MAAFGISKELVVTLKYYYEKNKSGGETMLKFLFFKVPLEFSLYYSNLKLFWSCFHNRFRTLAYSEPEVYWEACQYTLATLAY